MRKILKGAMVLLTVAVLIFSTSAVTADTKKSAQTELGENNLQPSIQTSSSAANRGLLWDNGDPDFVNGLCCQRIGSVEEVDLADDFHLDKKTTFERVVWETVDFTDYIWEGLDDLIIYEYGSTGPGTEVVVMLEVPNTRIYINESPWGLPRYRYEIDLLGQGLQFDLPKGDYYILLRPYTAGTTGQSFWLTSPAPTGSTSECYFRSDYFGVPNWSPATTQWGTAYDINFKIYGTQDHSREFKSPIINFLENHLNMFPLIQLLLQRLGLF